MLNVLHILRTSHILLKIDKKLVLHQWRARCLKTVRKEPGQYPSTLKHDEPEPRHLAQNITSGKEKPKGPTEPSQSHSPGQKSGIHRLNCLFLPNRIDDHSSIQGNFEIILSVSITQDSRR